MSTSYHAYAAVGVPVENVISQIREIRVRTRFDQDTGIGKEFQYEQLVVLILGEELPLSNKKIMSDWKTECPEYGYSTGLDVLEWVEKHGFDTEGIFDYHHEKSYNWCRGILGLSIPTKDAIELADVQKNIYKVSGLLKAIGCNEEPKLHVFVRAY